jgi:hypothetical protein
MSRRSLRILLCILGQPHRCGFAVVGAGGIGIFRRQAVLDAEDGEVARLGDALQALVLRIAGAHNPTAAVDVQINAIGLGGQEHAQRKRPVGSLDYAFLGIWGADNGPARTSSLGAVGADGLGCLEVNGWLCREQGGDLLVESQRFGVDGIAAEDRWVRATLLQTNPQGGLTQRRERHSLRQGKN